MNEVRKSCDTCTYAFYITDKGDPAPTERRWQHCKNPVYNSEEYTHTMLMEDWDRGYCRLWEPIGEDEEGHEYEEHLLHS